MKILNYTFKNKELLELALTQSGADSAHNNERLEFIGDRVLGLSVASLLYDMFPAEAEGELARRHATLVSTETLAQVATEIGLEAHIRHGHMTAGRIQHVLADAMEAVLGAVFTDSDRDYLRLESIILHLWKPLIIQYCASEQEPKTQLQELVHARSNTFPVYTLLDIGGSKHQPVFKVQVSALGKTVETLGHSKKEAETLAAREMLHLLRNDEWT